MTVNAKFARFADAEFLSTAGTPAIAGVVVGGFSLGFFAWYAFASHLGRFALASEGFFLLALPLGMLFALAAWRAYSEYFSRRTKVSLQTALRYDALTWTAPILLWLTFIQPSGAGTTGRTLAIAVAAFCTAKILVAARFNQTVRETVVTFAMTRITLIVIAELASVIIGQRAGQHVAASSHAMLAVWARWDAVHFLDIATRGYYSTDMAFFPLFPLLISLLGKLTGNHVIAGLLISNVAFFFGLLFFYKLVEHQYNRETAHRAIFYVSIFPTAIFFSAVYTEALFFALTAASFYYIRERKWIVAGAIGYLAAMTRVEGILLVVPFAMEALRARPAGTALREWWSRALGAVLIPLGLATYMAYLWVLRGDPLYFSHVQTHWHRHLAPPWVSVGNSLHLIATAHAAQTVANQIIELGFTVLMVGTLIAGIKRLRPSYWAYMALSIVVPMSTSSLMSMPRFALVLFPMFVLLALWGTRSTINNAIVAFSLPLLGLFTVLFADWFWVA